ncbi:MAG: hypothetical protein EAZ73_09275 [Oscillatoriales cyanobacterium]|uniref:hypothetical protein n=1 Tax=unclassified Microcoleus TaxID=2642155 RepID=UPI001D49C7D8|nr:MULTISPECIES: hypothetical protein [unclassified Microcoleus]TAF00835.1 MAG: hypothetical protein EAZ79_01320 [Oscillatoriales cyanobacterium]MCC3459828.1 hypothetical protein [Microcoleus sp. PH2017_11_PCY_U_A]MCC3478261.1 hypothetical protein [Microcoleus sp. PH2017_12_PCY_D_A]TAF21406.1 MAG: hypothetical protein EAZ73_09275 [Oscillatoriales cyanobacterium]TAF39667.1 MAG: hypothetical protein EAZ69_00070 [Oscillatoriales cyanobacterium]
MTEATFKRRLELLELCPEVDRRLYGRRFSDFLRWCLVEIERIYQQFDRSTEKTIEYLENVGLETANYFEETQNDYENRS